MLTLTLRRTDLVHRGACAEWLSIFDEIRKMRGDGRAPLVRRGGVSRRDPERLRVVLSPLAQIWLARDGKGAAVWLRGQGLLPPVSMPYGIDLRGADLRWAYLRGADLSGADLSEADLSGADLSEAYLRGAYLRGANLSEANLSEAYLSGADLRGAYLSGAPVIDDIHAKVYAAASQPGALDMGSWHCGTSHCRAGWVVTLAGQPGLDLEAKIGTPAAAMAIYMASDPERWKNERLPDFYCDNATALADMARMAGVTPPPPDPRPRPVAGPGR
jgi:hypothetical protein